MTGLGHSPPRSKKESYDASEPVTSPYTRTASFETAAEITAALDSISGSVPDEPVAAWGDGDEAAEVDDGTHLKLEDVVVAFESVDPADELPPVDKRQAGKEAKAAARAARDAAKQALLAERAAVKQAARTERQAAKQVARTEREAAKVVEADGSPDLVDAETSKREAKQLARAQRNAAREAVAVNKAKARADAAAAKAAARVDSETAERESPELADVATPEDEHIDAALAVEVVVEAPATVVEVEEPAEEPAVVEAAEETSEPAGVVDDVTTGPVEDDAPSAAEERANARRARAEAKQAALAARQAAKESARRDLDEAKQADADAVASAQAAVEAAAEGPATQQAGSTSPAEAGPVPAEAGDGVSDAAAKAAARRAKDEAKQAARREREEAKLAASRERAEAKQAARLAKTTEKDVDDHIVEPPREPKVSRSERRRLAAADKTQARSQKRDSQASPSPDGGSGALMTKDRAGPKRAVSVAAGLVGAIGLACSVVLAVGALLVALGTTDGNAFYDVVSTVSDVLVGPLRDAFSFSGTNADMKEALVAWGLGSMGYLVVGLVAQSVLRPRHDS